MIHIAVHEIYWLHLLQLKIWSNIYGQQTPANNHNDWIARLFIGVVDKLAIPCLFACSCLISPSCTDIILIVNTSRSSPYMDESRFLIFFLLLGCRAKRSKMTYGRICCNDCSQHAAMWVIEVESSYEKLCCLQAKWHVTVGVMTEGICVCHSWDSILYALRCANPRADWWSILHSPTHIQPIYILINRNNFYDEWYLYTNLMLKCSDLTTLIISHCARYPKGKTFYCDNVAFLTSAGQCMNWDGLKNMSNC